MGSTLLGDFEMDQELKQYLETITQGIVGLQGDVSGLKEDVSGLKGEVRSLSSRMDVVESEVKKANLTLENVVRRDLNLLSEGHQTLLERFDRTDAKLDGIEARLDRNVVDTWSNDKKIKEVQRILSEIVT